MTENLRDIALSSPRIKGVTVDGGYVIVTPVGKGKAQALAKFLTHADRDTFLRIFRLLEAKKDDVYARYINQSVTIGSYEMEIRRLGEVIEHITKYLEEDCVEDAKKFLKYTNPAYDVDR